MKQCNKSFTFSVRKRILRVPSAFISKASSSPTSVVKLYCRKKVRERIENENFSLFLTHFSRPFFLPTTLKRVFEGLCVTLHSNFLQVICCKNVFFFFSTCFVLICHFLHLSLPSAMWCTVTYFLPSKRFICNLYCLDSFGVSLHKAGRLIWSWAEMCTHLCVVGKTFCLLCQLASEQKCIVRACEKAFCFWTMYACTLFCLKGKIKHLVTWQTWENLFYLEA